MPVFSYKWVDSIEAAANDTALEINSQPNRLDVNDQACRRGKELGAAFVISTDAHSVEQMDHMRFGVATARRGWLEKKDVLNARPLKSFQRWLQDRK